MKGLRCLAPFLLVLALSGLLPAPALAKQASQTSPWPSRRETTLWNAQRLQLNDYGMRVLGAWAVANIGSGAVLAWGDSGEYAAFGEMTAMWNVVNLGIAYLGRNGILSQDPARISYREGIEASHRMEKALLFNAGLDVGYIMAGGWMREMGLRDDDDRLLGYGTAIIAQGAFLLAFDGVLWWLNARHRNDLTERSVTPSLALTPDGLSLTLRW